MPNPRMETADLRAAVLTVSDTRTPQTDRSGELIQELVTAARHMVVDYAIVCDEIELVRRQVTDWCQRGDIDAVLITGGTGFAPRDTTIEAVTPLLEKRLDGFGEMFRMLSFEDMGPAAMLSRAVAGTRSRTAIFCMPGSPAAVTLAMERLILPALPHLIALLRS